MRDKGPKHMIESLAWLLVSQRLGTTTRGPRSLSLRFAEGLALRRDALCPSYT